MTSEYSCLCSAAELDLKKTFECGQCFRWSADEKGIYSGIARGIPARLKSDGESVYIASEAPLSIWREYFDLECDYDAAARKFKGGEYLDKCALYGRGIRILRQEPWEALCSFIISQCNNIPRIKGIVERLCRDFGEERIFEGECFYTFPKASVLAQLQTEALAPLRCGYRAPYIISAARAVAEGNIELEALKAAAYVEAKQELLSLNGVGEKVANCVVLFGLHHMEAFPIDVWIRKALKEHFPADFDPASLGSFAGLAQQYVFYYARSTNNQG